MTTRKVRLAIVRDEGGRDLLVPWYPFSRTAYVLGSAERERARRHALRYLVFWAGLGVGLSFVSSRLDWPFWVPWLVVPPLVLDWAWWTRRFTRGLERTRYER